MFKKIILSCSLFLVAIGVYSQPSEFISVIPQPLRVKKMAGNFSFSPNTSITSAKRDSTQIDGWNSPKFDGKVHEGFYTQHQIKELIAYAADRT